jgi:hypothetical protein
MKSFFSRKRPSTSRRANRARPRLEQLEARSLLASWVGQIGGTGVESVQSRTVMDSAGNMYIGGSFFSTVADFDPSSGVTNLSNAGASDAYVAKYSPDGNLLWARRFGGSQTDATNSLRLDAAEGSLYVTGNYGGSADFSGDNVADLTSAGGSDVFIAKLDALTGGTVWQRSVGGTSADNGYDVAFANGVVYVAGDFKGTADFNPGSGVFSMTPAGKGKNLLEDGFILKLNETGDFSSASQIGSAAFDSIQNLVATNAGLYVQGSVTGAVDIDPTAGVYTLQAPSGVAATPFLVGCAASGSVSWGKLMSGAEIPRDQISLGNDAGFLYVTGEFGQSANLNVGSVGGTLTSAGSRDAFVAKYAQSNGSFEWARSIGGTGYDTARGAAVVRPSDGSVFVGGWFYGTVDFNPGTGNGGELTSAGETDDFIWQVDAAGNYQNAWRMGGSLADGGAKPVGVVAGVIYVTGRFQAQADFPTGGSLTSKGSLDVFLMALDESTQIGSASFAAAGTMSTSPSSINDGQLVVEDTPLDSRIEAALAELSQPSKRKRNLSDAVDEIFMTSGKSATNAWANDWID